MPALSESDRIEIITARTLARADSRTELIDALALCDSPALAALGGPGASMGTVHAAALGQAQGIIEFLIGKVEALAAELDRRGCEHRCTRGYDCGGCGCEGCGRSAPAPVWAVWRIDEGTGMARELGQLPRPRAEVMADQLNRDRRRPVHFLALPLGGSPFDIPDDARNPYRQAATS